MPHDELRIALPPGIDPPVRDNAAGETRRIGVELELTELDVPAIAAIVAAATGGEVRQTSDYEAFVESEELGEFKIEADLSLLRKIGQDRAKDGSTPNRGAIARALRDMVAAAAEVIAPMEIVGPPIPYPKLPIFDRLVEQLAARGALGTQAGPMLAFGMQLNPELPRLDATTIYRHLRAYLVVAPWLRRLRGVDMSRRVTPFVDPHPDEYVTEILRVAEAPSIEDLIDDYLAHNPTRNRDLDMLPLFAHLDESRVRAVVGDSRLKSRPTFHYRLPDSRVGESGWRVTDEWRHWLVVERLAAQPALLDELAGAYLALIERSYADAVASFSTARTLWSEQCADMLARLDAA